MSRVQEAQERPLRYIRATKYGALGDGLTQLWH